MSEDLSYTRLRSELDNERRVSRITNAIGYIVFFLAGWVASRLF